VTRRSVMEYAEVFRPRYGRAFKNERGRLLDEFTKVTGWHCKASIRLLNRTKRLVSRKRQGRPVTYGPGVAVVLKEVWEASDRLCSKRLQPFIPEMVRVLRQQGEQRIDASMAARLCQMSPSTIDRFLRSHRQIGGRKPLATTRPGSLLKHSIPIRTFADWQEGKSGFMEIDLVAHCGDSADGFYLNTLCAVDIASGWTECLPVLGKWQERVQQAVYHMRTASALPSLGYRLG
jgi:hypothetical protein